MTVAVMAIAARRGSNAFRVTDGPEFFRVMRSRCMMLSTSVSRLQTLWLSLWDSRENLKMERHVSRTVIASRCF